MVWNKFTLNTSQTYRHSGKCLQNPKLHGNAGKTDRFDICGQLNWQYAKSKWGQSLYEDAIEFQYFVKFNLLQYDIYYLVKIGNLCGGSGDKKIRSRGTLLIRINQSCTKNNKLGLTPLWRCKDGRCSTSISTFVSAMLSNEKTQ